MQQIARYNGFASRLQQFRCFLFSSNSCIFFVFVFLREPSPQISSPQGKRSRVWGGGGTVKKALYP